MINRGVTLCGEENTGCGLIIEPAPDDIAHKIRFADAGRPLKEEKRNGGEDFAQGGLLGGIQLFEAIALFVERVLAVVNALTRIDQHPQQLSMLPKCTEGFKPALKLRDVPAHSLRRQEANRLTGRRRRSLEFKAFDRIQLIRSSKSPTRPR